MRPIKSFGLKKAQKEEGPVKLKPNNSFNGAFNTFLNIVSCCSDAMASSSSSRYLSSSLSFHMVALVVPKPPEKNSLTFHGSFLLNCLFFDQFNLASERILVLGGV